MVAMFEFLDERDFAERLYQLPALSCDILR